MTPEEKQKINEIYADHEEIPYVSPDRNLSTWFSKAKLNASEKVPKRNMIRTEEGLLPGDIILLWRISHGTFTTEATFHKYFEYDYGINGPENLQNLIDEGYLVEQSAKESLDKTTAPALRSILKEFDIKAPTKLKKAELVELAETELSEDQLDDYIFERNYALTDKGSKTLQNNQYVVDKHLQKPIYK